MKKNSMVWDWLTKLQLVRTAVVWYYFLKYLKVGKPMAGHSNFVFTWPNFLTILRIVAVGVAIYFGFNQEWLKALVVIVIGALSDNLDGKIARKYGTQSVLGAYLDPIADKISLLVIIVLSPAFCLIIAGLEFIGAIFSNIIRQDETKGGHFIGDGSKDITLYQLTVVGILYLNKTELIFNYSQYLETMLLSVLIGFSISRLSIYRSIFFRSNIGLKHINKFKSVWLKIMNKLKKEQAQ